MFDHVRRIRLLVILVLGLVLTNAGPAKAVGVRPLVVEMNVRPGDVRDFEIALIPSDKEELVDLTLYEPVQQITGALVYQLPTNPAFSATSWVTLDSNVVRVYPDSEGKVTGKVTVPFSASGSHTVIIMVEPRPPEITSGIGFQVRYAVRLSIRVERPGLRQTAELPEVGLEVGAQGQPVVRAVLQNTSPWDYLVEGEATIRDAERRLVERIPLLSRAGTSAANQTTRLYPGARVEFLGEVTKRLLPGEYTLRTYFRYGDQGQIVKEEVISIAEGDFNFPLADQLGAFSLSTAAIEIAAKPGERKSQVLEFTSEVGDGVLVVVETRSLGTDYTYSVTDWIQLRMAGNEFQLPARRNSRLGLTIAVPREAADGSYHGIIVAQAFENETGQLLTEKIVPVTVLVGETHERKVEMRTLYASRDELVLDLFNAGNVRIRPQAEAVISNSNGEFLGRVILTLPEGEEAILPLKSQRLEGRTSQLEPGVYHVEISVKEGGIELLKVAREIEVL